jgi:predicted ATPase
MKDVEITITSASILNTRTGLHEPCVCIQIGDSRYGLRPEMAAHLAANLRVAARHSQLLAGQENAAIYARNAAARSRPSEQDVRAAFDELLGEWDR